MYNENRIGPRQEFCVTPDKKQQQKPAGTTSSDREPLTSLVIEGRRRSKQFLTTIVGHGSNKRDFVGDFIIVYCISSSETVLKWSNVGRPRGSESVKMSVLEKESLILVILSEKKSQSSWQSFSESHEKEVQFQEQTAM